MLDDDKKQKIVGLLSGELDGEEAKEVEELIRLSVDAAEYHRETSKLWATMDSVEQIEPSADFMSDFWKRVENEEEKSSFFSFLGNFNKKFAFVGSLAVFLLISTFVVNNYFYISEDENYLTNSGNGLLLGNLGDSMSLKTPDSLNIYGPWDEFEN